MKATDPEEMDVTTSVVSALPKGASFDAETGTFTWNTSDSDSGQKEFTFKAVDEFGASAQKMITVNVEAGSVRMLLLHRIPIWQDGKAKRIILIPIMNICVCSE